MQTIKVLIIEDEPLAAKRLEQMVTKHQRYTVIKILDTVKAASIWLANESPDLAFFDIQLADGLSFDIFNNVEVKCPIIFTTAFDEYAIKAFKVNSVDYLLKPIDTSDLGNALKKFESNFMKQETFDVEMIQNVLSQFKRREFKERFVIRVGEHLKSLKASDVIYFVSEDKTTYAVDSSGKKYILDQSLDELQQQLDPQYFFRINRKYIVHIDASTDIISYSNSRLKLVLKMCDDNAVIVSRERVIEFKAWLDR